MWAKHNIQDADGNELYFAWGETQGYTSGQVGTDKNFVHGEYIDESGVTYRNDYKFWSMYESGECGKMTKYSWCDFIYTLEPEDDAATVNCGSDWKMPTKEQFDELTANTTTAWTQVDGINGLLFTSKVNTNTLFFPAVGYAEIGKVYNVGSYGRYWCDLVSDANVGYAFKLYFSEWSLAFDEESFRGSGCSVRPVRSNN